MNGICQRRAAVRRRRDRTGSLLRSGICVGACCLVGAAALLAGCPSSGPVGKATVYTDVHGVPHVYGETEYDVMFGLGYAMARDQLDTIVTLYRVASGRLSAKEGPGDEFSNVVSDYLTHLFLVPESAAAAYAAITENERAWLDGFADGLNA